MKALFLTNEYPPHVYGGAGVHVEFLSRELAKLIEVEVRSFGDQAVNEGRLTVRAYGLDESGFTAPRTLAPVFGAFARNVAMAATNVDADVVHCHTWYSHLGGITIKQAYGIPLVLTTHSLEPLRPWKREQLGGGYDFSVWVEKTALEMAGYHGGPVRAPLRMPDESARREILELLKHRLECRAGAEPI